MLGEWPEYPLEELCELIVDCPHSTPKWTDQGVVVLRNQYIRNGRLDLSDPSYTTEEDYEARIKRAVPTAGDLVLTREAPMGEVCKVPEGLRCCLGQRMVLIRANRDLIEPDYLLFAIQSPYLQHQISWSEGTGTTVSNIRLPDLRGFKIPTPSLEIQRWISGVLKALDDKTSLNRQINTTLESMAQALFKSWFVDFDPVIDNALAAGNEIPDALQKRAARREALRQQTNKTANKTTEATDADSPEQALPDTGLSDQRLPPEIQQLFPDRFVFTEEMGWVPEGWEVQPFGDLIETTIGGDWGKEVPDDKHTRRVAIIRGTDLPTVRSASKGAIPFRWVEDKKFKTRELVDGDLVIEVSGGSPKQPTGRSTYITQDTVNMLEGSVVAASFCRKLRPVSKHVGLLLALHLDRIYGEGKMWSYQNQSTGISNFQTKVFLESEFVITPNKEELLVSFFEIVRPLINKSRSNDSETLADIRDSLLPKLLSGQITIPDAEQQLAEVL